MRHWVAAGAVSLALIAGVKARSARLTTTRSEEPAPKPKIVEGPKVQYVSSHHAVVSWTTSDSTPTLLRFGTSRDELGSTDRVKRNRAKHIAELSHLKPNTTYYYRVYTAGHDGTPISEVGSFTTKSKGAHPVREPERH
jgi:phosphodiesterase/alkaline phosphatase D-like protein